MTEITNNDGAKAEILEKAKRGKKVEAPAPAAAGAELGDQLDCTVQGEKLAEVVGVVAKAVAKGHSLPILRGLLLECGKDGLQVTGTDLDVRQVGWCACGEVRGLGALVVGADRLSAVLKGVKGEVRLRQRGGFLVVSGSGWEAHLVWLEAADFPPEHEMREGGRAVQLSAGIWRALLAHVPAAASEDSSRYALNGVCLQVRGDLVRLVATDGRRAARAGVISSGAVIGGGDVECIIPTRLVGLLKGALVDMPSEEEVALGLGEDGGIVRWVKMVSAFGDSEVLVVSGKCIEGTFPNVDQVWPKHEPQWVHLRGDLLVDMVQRVKSVLALKMGKTSGSGVKVRIEGKCVSVKGCQAEVGEYEAEAGLIMCEGWAGRPREWSLNPDLVSVLGPADLEGRLDVGGDDMGPIRYAAPVHVELHGVKLEVGYEGILMPMRSGD